MASSSQFNDTNRRSNGKSRLNPGPTILKGAALLVLLLGFAAAAGAQTSATLVDLGAAAPTPGAADIAQLSTNGNQLAPDGLNYYTDDAVNGSGNGEPGQTFTTPSTAGGYTLSSLAIRTSGLDSYNSISTSQDYYLHIYSIANGTATIAV